MSRGVGSVRGRRPSVVWWGRERGFKQAKPVNYRAKLAQSVVKLAWLHMHRAPRARRSYTNLKTMVTSLRPSVLLAWTTELAQTHNQRFIHVFLIFYFEINKVEIRIFVLHVFFVSIHMYVLEARQIQTRLYHPKREGMEVISWQVVIDPPSMRRQRQICQIVGLVFAWCPSQSWEAGHQMTSQNRRLKGHFNSDRSSFRGEQSGSETNRPVCQACNKSAGSCLHLIAPSPWILFPGKKKKINSETKIDGTCIINAVNVNLKMSAMRSVTPGIVSVAY